MNYKKILLKIFKPHLAITILLLPFSVVGLVFSLLYLNAQSIISILFYVVSFYELVVICFRIPSIIEYINRLKKSNTYINKWLTDPHLRVKTSLYTSLVINFIYALFQLGLGVKHNSLWFYSTSIYYLILGFIRLFLFAHTKRYKANIKTDLETNRYILAGVMLIFANLALGVIIFYIVSQYKIFNHHMITTIAMSAYTFTALTFAIINFIKYKKYKSLVYNASKKISLIGATVSMLILESTMLTTFGEQSSERFSKVILLFSGIVILVFASYVALTMIIKGYKEKRTPSK